MFIEIVENPKLTPPTALTTPIIKKKPSHCPIWLCIWGKVAINPLDKYCQIHLPIQENMNVQNCYCTLPQKSSNHTGHKTIPQDLQYQFNECIWLTSNMKQIIGRVIEYFKKRFNYFCFIWALFGHLIKNDSLKGNKICYRWWFSTNSQYFSGDGRVKYLTWHFTAHKWKVFSRKWKGISFIVLIVNKYSMIDFVF